MKKIRMPGFGFIVRTVSEGVPEADLKSDGEFLLALWKDILAKQENLQAPALLHSDLSLTLRVVRDLFTKKVDRLWIDSKEEFEEVKEFVRRYLPEQTSRLFHYDKEEGLFDHLGVEMEISPGLEPKSMVKNQAVISSSIIPRP